MDKKFFSIKICLFFTLATFFFQPFLHADIYMYKDENGIMHFTNQSIPRTSRKYKFFMSEKEEEAYAAPRARLYDEIIQLAAATHNLEEDLIKAVMRTESAFNPNAVSRKGAMGLMQLMPETAKRMGVSDPFIPMDNVLGGARYLRMMLDQFDGNVEFALAAYNAGPSNVLKYNGVPPFRETKDYIRKVNRFREQYKK